MSASSLIRVPEFTMKFLRDQYKRDLDLLEAYRFSKGYQIRFKLKQKKFHETQEKQPEPENQKPEAQSDEPSSDKYSDTFMKELQKMREVYEHYEQSSYNFLKAGKPVKSIRDFVCLLSMAKFKFNGPSELTPLLQKYCFNNPEAKPSLEEICIVYDIAAELLNGRLMQDSEVKVLFQLQKRIWFPLKDDPKCPTKEILNSLIPSLMKGRVIGEQFLDRIDDAVLRQRRQSKSLAFRTLALYSLLPTKYSPKRLNSYFMDQLSFHDVSLSAKINVLLCLMRFGSLDEQLSIVSAEQRNALINDVFQSKAYDMDLNLKMQLFNTIKLFRLNQEDQDKESNDSSPEQITNDLKSKLRLPNGYEAILKDKFKRHSMTIESNIQKEVGTMLKEMGYEYKSEELLEDSFFVDFKVDFRNKSAAKHKAIVLQVDGPSHFWRAGYELEYKRTDTQRTQVWEKLGYRFGAVPYHLWGRYTQPEHRRVLLRSCLDGKKKQSLEKLAESFST